MGKLTQLEKEVEWKKRGKGLQLGQGLKIKHRYRAFIAEYISNGWNGADAAKSVGYKHPKEAAARILNLPVIKKALNNLQQKNEAKAILTEEALIARLESVVEADITDAYGPQWIVVDDPKDIPEDLRKIMQKVKVTAIETLGGVRRYKVDFELMNKMHATELLMRCKGMFERDNKQKHGDTNISISFDSMIEKARAQITQEEEYIDGTIKRVNKGRVPKKSN